MKVHVSKKAIRRLINNQYNSIVNETSIKIRYGLGGNLGLKFVFWGNIGPWKLSASLLTSF